MYKSPWIALVLATCLWAVPVAAQVVCTPDVELPSYNRAFYFSADTPRWQEFVPSRTSVCEVTLVVHVDHLGGDLLLDIEDDLGTVLGQSSVAEAQLLIGTNAYPFYFTTPVASEDLHRLVLSTDQPDAFPAPYYWEGDEDSVYEEGTSDVHHGGVEGFDYAFTVSTEIPTAVPEIPGTKPFVLYDAAPNPFNPATTISFVMTTRAHVRLTVYDPAGRLVTTLVDQVRGRGPHDAVWEGRDAGGRLVASGVYLYQIQVGSVAETRGTVLLK